MPATPVQKKLQKDMKTLKKLMARCRQMRAELEEDPAEKASNPVGAPRTSRLKQPKIPSSGGQKVPWRSRKPRALEKEKPVAPTQK